MVYRLGIDDRGELKAIRPVLLGAMKDEQPEVRVLAIQVLRQLGTTRRPRESFAALAGRSKTADPAVRLEAGQSLVFRGGTPEAKAALADDDRGCSGRPRRAERSQAAPTLGQLGVRAREAIPALSALRDDPDPSVRSQAGAGAGTDGPGGGQGLAAGPDRDAPRGRPDARMQAVNALAVSSAAPRRRRRSRRWSRCSAAADRNVRFQAFQYLGQMGADAKEALPAMVGLLRDSDTSLRSQAAGALARMGHEGAKAALPDPPRGPQGGRARTSAPRRSSGSGSSRPTR